MSPERHRELATRIHASLPRLTRDDWEMRIEAAMLAGTHWVNLVLHQQGVSAASEDMIHTNMTIVNYLRKYSLAQPRMVAALAEIEELRPLYVRGDLEGGPEAGERALQLLDELAALAALATAALEKP